MCYAQQSMIFSSPIFVFGFLPLVFMLYYLSARPYRNAILLICSLLFYSWGEGERLAIMLLSISMNYATALLTDRSSHPIARKLWLAVGLAGNLGLLLYFKYTFFALTNLNILAHSLGWNMFTIERIILPLGISFFTFQGISYIVDVYRKSTPVQTNPFNLALYITFFPQLIAGPIVRYHDISLQLLHRNENLSLFTSGIKRFITGLAKKVLIADTLAKVDDLLFSQSPESMGALLAWMGIIIAVIRVYYDFSGYSDMAIGMGRMFGFRLLENFNFPLSVTSMRALWTHWHISLSNWFRDYLYVPLGGNRKGVVSTQFNLWLVFFLSGLWHGAEWTFVLFGAYHGIFMVAERAGMEKWLKKIPGFLQNLYVWMVFSLGMVLFRSPDLSFALTYAKQLFAWSTINPYHDVWIYLQPYFWAIATVGFIFCYPLARRVYSYSENHFSKLIQARDVLVWMMYAILFLTTIAGMAGSSYSPFIYFRF